MKLISEQYNGISVEITIGEQIAIQLPENPTTGYSWDSSDWHFPDNIDMLLNQFLPTAPTKVGSGGYRRWIIKPTKAGTYQIELGYQRNWESNPVATFGFTLEVVKPEPLPKTDPKAKPKDEDDV
jgi:inhibitor of cysteine peptidase